MGKYVIESKFENTRCFLEVACENGEPYFFINRADSLMPYTEHDIEQVRKEAYDKGYETAKHECEDCNANAVKIADDNAHEAYQKGLEDAWEAAIKVVALSTVDRRKVFGSEYMYSILENHTASEAIEKIRAYEQEQDGEIKVGDEVINQNKTAVVTEITNRYTRIMYSDGSGYALFAKGLTKTGRHFHEIAEVLAKMKES